MTMGRHGNRLHHLATPCIPHGCSLSLRAELHPAEPGGGSDRWLGAARGVRGGKEGKGVSEWRRRGEGTLNFGG